MDFSHFICGQWTRLVAVLTRKTGGKLGAAIGYYWTRCKARSRRTNEEQEEVKKGKQERKGKIANEDVGKKEERKERQREKKERKKERKKE